MKKLNAENSSMKDESNSAKTESKNVHDTTNSTGQPKLSKDWEPVILNQHLNLEDKNTFTLLTIAGELSTASMEDSVLLGVDLAYFRDYNPHGPVC